MARPRSWLSSLLLVTFSMATLLLPAFLLTNTVAQAQPTICPPNSTTRTGTGVITGIVTASDTNQPLVGVSVFADGPGFGSATTDSAGRYRIDELPAGSYTVSFTLDTEADRTRYIEEYYNNQFNRRTATKISVSDGATTSNINAALDRGGVISGRVTAADTGNGLSNVSVTTSSADGSFSSFDRTNADGTYTTSALPSGTYTVRFSSFSNPDYLEQVYNNKQPTSQGDLVSVTAPNATTNINAALARGGSITGRVTGADTNAGLVGVSVSAKNADGIVVETTFTTANGAYTLRGLPTGTYIVTFEGEPDGQSAPYVRQSYNNKPEGASADVVGVTAPNVTPNINATLQRGGQIAGRVTLPDGKPLSSVTVNVINSAGIQVAEGRTGATGVYTTTAVVNGSYKLQFSNFNYASEWYNDKPDRASADAVAVTSPNVTQNINAVMDTGGCIAGRVTDANGNGVSGSSVFVYDANNQFITLTDTQADGTYITRAVLFPGSYRVQAYTPNFDSSTFYNGKGDFASADPVIVTGKTPTNGISIVLGARVPTPTKGAGNQHRVHLPLVVK